MGHCYAVPCAGTGLCDGIHHLWTPVLPLIIKHTLNISDAQVSSIYHDFIKFLDCVQCRVCVYVYVHLLLTIAMLFN